MLVVKMSGPDMRSCLSPYVVENTRRTIFLHTQGGQRVLELEEVNLDYTKRRWVGHIDSLPLRFLFCSQPLQGLRGKAPSVETEKPCIRFVFFW